MNGRIFLFIGLFFPFFLSSNAQDIKMSATAGLEQVYGNTITSENLMPFNEINVEFGYVLYEAKIDIESEDAVLELENVRDYAAVYVDSISQGAVTNNERRITLNVGPGERTLRVYAENIGRITYGPEILDNSKGLFGRVTVDGEEIVGWKITPLKVRDLQIQDLKFDSKKLNTLPGFHKGFFSVSDLKDTYLNMAGWGMGEVWINGQYIGSYWEKEKLQSVQVVADILKKEKNEIVIFELQNNSQKTVGLADQPIFN